MEKSNGTRKMTTKRTENIGVSCQICGCMSTGFHYGAYTCEGCKAFFYRCLKKKPKFGQCRERNNCRNDTGSKFRCRICRYKKCILAGMSAEAVRIGRRKTAELKVVKGDKTTKNEDKGQELTDSFYDAFYKHSVSENPSGRDNLELVIGMLDTVDFQRIGIIELFQEMIVPVIRNTIEFAKRIPGFLKLRLCDRVILIKQGAFSVCMLMIHQSFTGKQVQLRGKQTSICLTEKAIKYSLELHLFLGSIIQISERIHQFNFHTAELALFASVILLSDNTLLEERNRIMSLYEDSIQLLQKELFLNRPNAKETFLSLMDLKFDLKQVSMEFTRNNSAVFPKLLGNQDECESQLLLKELFEI